MRKYLYHLFIIVVISTLIGCSEEPPSIRVQNQNLSKSNVQIKTSSNTINHNDIAPGGITNFQDIAEGKVEITAVIQNESVSPVTNFNASNDHNYTIIILNSTPPSLKVNSDDK